MATIQSSDRDVQIVRQLALTATFTALVFMSTAIFSFELVPTTGYFNFGESFVFLAALIGGPIVGAIAGGFGSFLADSFLGFGEFAFATLVLKGLEGFVVGLLFNFSDRVDRKKRRVFLILISLFIILFTVILNISEGSFIAEGRFALGTYTLPGVFLILFAVLLTGIIWLVEFRLKYRGKMALSCILAGPIIVVGYFLWEVIALRIAVEAALFEVPFNIAQVIFGTLIAVPIVTYLDDLGVIPSRMGTKKEKPTNDNFEPL
ncbi:MAG: ECF transporter S component [Candidatus Hodarchaeales archaeon]|jgi:uncharacterized membrane protein